MSEQECDELGHDLLKAARLTQKRHGNCFDPNPERLEKLLDMVEDLKVPYKRLYATIDTVVQLQGLSPAETELYTRALKKVFGRRIGAKKEALKRMEEALNFPRGQVT